MDIQGQRTACTASSGCNATSWVTLASWAVNANPTVDAGAAVAAICQGGTSAVLNGSYGGGATSAVWTDNPTGGSFMNNAGTTPNNATYTASAASSSPVTLTLTTSGGLCGTTSANKTITVDPLPTIAAGSDENVCDNSTLILLPASGTNYNAASISWSVLSGCGSCSFSSGSYTLTPTFTPDATGSDHTAIVQILVNGNGSCSSSTTTSNKNITIYATPGTPSIKHD